MLVNIFNNDLDGKASTSHTHSEYSTTAHTHSNVSSATAGFAPAGGSGTTKYLRQDGTWQVPPDNNTTYKIYTALGDDYYDIGFYPNTYGDSNYRRFIRVPASTASQPELTHVINNVWTTLNVVTSQLLWKKGSYSLIHYEDASWDYNIGANVYVDISHTFPVIANYSILFVHVKSTGSNNVLCWGTSWSGSTYTVRLANYTNAAQNGKKLLVQIMYVRNSL